MAACKSCGVAIDWAVDPKGKRVPVDQGTRHDGNLAVRQIAPGSLAVRYLRSRDTTLHGERRTTSHFATCPDAQQWRDRGTQEVLL